MPTGAIQSEERLIPDFWIRPDTTPVWLANRPTASTDHLTGGLARVTHTVRLDSGHVDSVTLTYRESEGIPLLYVETQDGKEVRRIEVLSLTIGN